LIDGHTVGGAAARVVVFLLCRYAGLKIWHAAVCIILGFYLASTSFAPYISQFTESIFRNL
jgi:hypothetical protein